MLNPQASKAFKEEAERLGFINCDEMLKTAKPLKSETFPTGSYILQGKADINKYTFFLCPAIANPNGYMLQGVTAQALEYILKDSSVAVAYDAKYAPIPHKYYIDEQLRKMRRMHVTTEALLSDKSLAKEFKKLGFDIKNPAMVHIGSTEPFSIFSFGENVTIPRELTRVLEYSFVVGPADRKAEIVHDAHKEVKSRHIVAIQVSLGQQLNSEIGGPSEIIEKTYGIGNNPFPSRDLLKKAILDEADRISQVRQKAGEIQSSKNSLYGRTKRPGS